MINFTFLKKAIIGVIILLVFPYSYAQEIDIIGNGTSIADGETNTSTIDFTDFGSETTRSFTIDNSQGTGNTTLTVSAIDLNNTTNFSVSVNPTNPNPVGIAKNGPNANFTISLLTSAIGVYTSKVTITSDATNDGGDGHTFYIRASVGPEINIQGNSMDISNGSNSPSELNNTDFGSIAANTIATEIFSIQNLGSANLILTDGSPFISITGDDASDFEVNQIPISPISAQSSSEFSIDFNPTTSGVKNATLTIANNDSNTSSYTFNIRGTSVAPSPEIQVQGNGQDINNGDLYPTTSNDTNFGSVDISNTSTKTYTISNTGTTPLSISNISLSNTTDFEIVTPFYSSPIDVGNSTQFSIRYTGASGKHSSTVTITNNDSDEGSFEFVIRGSTRATSDTSLWSVTNITADSELNYPYEMTYGPDGFLWITERVGKKVVKVSPADGINSKTTMLDLSGLVYQTAGQDGLMGMAIHPDLYTDINTSNNFVYLAYTYDSGGRKLRIARYTYNTGTGLLNSSSATTIIEGIDASNDHNSGRLIIGPDLKLYYTIGDQGANQFGNACNPIQAQELPSSPSDYDPYKGKILRLNLDGTIPSDNPTLSGVQSHVYTYGHRNTQGIIFGSNGKLYASEHGAKVDDELNLITAGKNYGWPHIAGYYDNLAYSYCNWSITPGGCSTSGFSDHNCPSGVSSVQEFDAVNNSLLSNFQPPIGTYDSTTNYDPSGGWLTWPTVAPSSIDIYEGGIIPNWGQSLLISTLKEGTIFRAKLNTSGDALVDITTNNQFEEFHSSNDRYRDFAMDPDGLTFYAITDTGGTTSGPSGSSSVSIDNPGVIMKFKYIGPTSTTTYYTDADGDNYGDTNDTTGTEFSSNPGAGYSLNNTDCDDTDDTVNTPQQYYVDADGDGFGSTTTAMLCEASAPSGYSDNNTDCDDTDDTVNTPQQYYVDADGDGFGSTTTAMLCEASAPSGY
ncbi:PQQ-dependent sugar dehydrogenase, partial [Thalassobellus sediminis]|uniref:PQQ-dependent sugar dehydrogenase n=1 Tax=Thalassobellus sediminis TaxID=3367753 RepID=UPI0037BD7215